MARIGLAACIESGCTFTAGSRSFGSRDWFRHGKGRLIVSSKPPDEALIRIGQTIERDADRLVRQWLEITVAETPRRLAAHRDELRDHLPGFLRALGCSLADLHESSTPECTRHAIDHGKQRWDIGWQLADLIHDYRVLRFVILRHLESDLGRSLRLPEIMAVGHFIGEAVEAAVQAYQAHEMAQSRASEARHRAILEAALDSIITIDQHGTIIEFNPAAERTFGYSREQAIGQPMAELIIPSAERESHHAGMMRYLTTGIASILGRRLEMSALRADGTQFPVELTVTRVPDDGPPLFTAFLRDITVPKRIERRREALLAITRVLAQSNQVAEAATGVLQAVCESIGWTGGIVWTLDRDSSVLRCTSVWTMHRQNEDGFWQANQQRTFSPGEGLPGRVWSSGNPAWIADVTQDSNFPRADWAAQEGFRAAFAFPITVGPEFLGVMEFFAEQVREPDPDLLDAMGRIGGQIGEFMARKRADEAVRESEARFRMMADSAPVLLWVSNADGEYTFLNKSWLEFTGRSFQEELGRGWVRAVHPEDREKCLWIRGQAIANRQPFRTEFRLRCADGTYRWMLDNGLPRFSPSGKLLGLIGSAVDVSESKNIEQQLVALNDRLEQQVAERTAVAERRANQLRRLAADLTQTEHRERKRLAQFLHDELQQLMVGAKMRLATVIRQAEKEDLRRALAEVDDLINQSIETSRTLTAELSPAILHDAGLPAALEWLARWMQQTHGLTVAVEAEDGPGPADWDVRILLFEVVRELLFNVAKHAQVDRASVRLLHPDRDRIRIVVDDPGVGFDEAAQAAQSDLGGFGLFSIRERLELIGGTVAVQTAPGQGTRVTVEVPTHQTLRTRGVPTAPRPLSSSEFDIPVAHGTEPYKAGQIRVMLVDDHAVVRQGLASILRRESGIRLVAEAADGQQAADLARELRPDVIVMDVSMPVMNGIEATRVIKGELPHIRIIGLSLHEKSDMAEQMLSAGADAYLSKGGPAEELLAAIRG